MSASTIDCQNHPVAVGDRVKILAITPDLSMDEDELDLFYEMVGAICEVERIHADGLAWVAVWWNGDEGTLATTVGLGPQQMLRVA